MGEHSRASDVLVGRTLGEFVLRERIGEGGFGAVYRAIQPALDREAVVKVLHARLNSSKAAAERFLREAKLASKLDHPYAAHIYAFGAEPDGQLWIAMELVRGTPLDQVLKLQGPLSLERFVPLLDRICEVVHTAHESGIVHRDLKPANVMVLARAGRLLPKLLDLGIAKGLAESTDQGLATGETLGAEVTADGDAFAETLNTPTSGLTVRGAIMGSPPYMAPEQWVDAGTVDGRTDLYALGVLAFECLTGRPPFIGQTMTAIATAHASQPPPPLGARFPSALDKVLAKVLAKEAADRYADALTFAAAVRAASGIATEPTTLPPIDPVQREAAITGAPQPIAEAIAAFEASRSTYQARDALSLVGRTAARYLGLLALACRSRVSGDDTAGELMRTLYRRPLADREWIELARQLTAGWRTRRDAYPIPELVGAFETGNVGEQLEALVALRDAEAGGEATVLAQVETAVVQASRLLEGLAFLRDYPLVVTTAGGYAERWMGVRRASRSTIAVRGKGLTAGAPALLDRDGVPVLTLEPLFQIAAPTPGAPLDLFMFEGRDRRGAKLVALPAGFEYHDDELWDWLRGQLAGSLDEHEASVVEDKAPYRGLSAFSAEDNAMFVGREKQVDAFVNRLKTQPLLVVVGRSGAGKSSFVHAGVVPALQPTWRAITLRPGPSPLGSLIARLEHAGIAPTPEWSTGEQRTSMKLPVVTSLRDAISFDREALGHLLRADAAANGPIVLVIDQLEEMFTLCTDDAERKLFADAIAAAARSPEDPVRVVFTLRDDFLMRTEQVSTLRNRVGQGLQILTVPAPEDLLRIVTEPARRVGYELEGELAQDMVKEVADQPGALALISFTASKLWELRDRHFKQLTRSAYKTLGGVGGALARHAELTLDAMPPEERALTREAFRHLVTSQNTRAVLPRKDLRQLLGSDAHAEGVIEKLVAARLLVASENDTGAETIEVIHEALLTSWPRLVEWRREDTEGTRFREQLRAAAKQWDERSRVKGLLWRGDALGELTRWRGRHTGPLTDVEAAFTDASLADVARTRRTVRALIAISFAVLAAGIVALLIFNANIDGQRARAETAAKELHDSLQRRYEDQGRQLVLADDPLHALAYLDKARELGANGPSHDLLVAEAIEKSNGKLIEVHHDHAIRSVAFSPNGSRLITASLDRSAVIWDATSGAKLHELPNTDIALDARFAPDGATALTVSVDTTTLWDTTSGKAIRTFVHHHCARYTGDGKSVVTLGSDGVAMWDVATGIQHVIDPSITGGPCAISPDGALFAVGGANGIQIVNLRTAGVVQTIAAEIPMLLRFSPDNTQLATTTENLSSATVWTVATGKRAYVVAHAGPIGSITYNARGDLLATGSSDRTVAIWNAKTGMRIRVLAGHSSGVSSAEFSPDGEYVVSGSKDATVVLWDVASGEVEARWRGHEDIVLAVAFDPTGSRVATAGGDAAAFVWKVEPQQRVIWLTGHGAAGINNVRFSGSGDRVVTAGGDGTTRVWTAAGAPVFVLKRDDKAASDAAFSPDDREIASTGEDGMLQIWDAQTGVRRRQMSTNASQGGDQTDQFTLLNWSPAGDLLATASHDGTITCWDTRTWTQRFQHRGNAGYITYSVSFAPDGKSLMTADADRTTRVWDLSGRELASRSDPESPTGAQLDPLGKRVVSVEVRQRATIWNFTTGRVEAILNGHTGGITDAEWSSDGSRVVTSAWDNTARIWDAATGDALAIITHPTQVSAASFARDGRRFVMGGTDGRAAIHVLPRYDGAPEELARLLRCRVPYEVESDRLRPRARVCR